MRRYKHAEQHLEQNDFLKFFIILLFDLPDDTSIFISYKKSLIGLVIYESTIISVTLSTANTANII